MLLLINTVSEQDLQVGTAARRVFSFGRVADASYTCCEVVSSQHSRPMIGTIVLSNTALARNKNDQSWFPWHFRKRTRVRQYIMWIQAVLETG